MATMSTWRQRKIGPPYIKFPSGMIVYDEKDILDFINYKKEMFERMPRARFGPPPGTKRKPGNPTGKNGSTKKAKQPIVAPEEP